MVALTGALSSSKPRAITESDSPEFIERNCSPQRLSSAGMKTSKETLLEHYEDM